MTAEGVSVWIESGFVLYSTLLLIKMAFNLPLIARARTKNKIFGNPEDIKHFDEKHAKLNVNHPDLNRVLRMFANDLESIVPFILMSALYIIAVPGSPYAIWHFRVYFGARVLMSFFHYFAIMPWRSISWLGGTACYISLASQILYRAGPELIKYM